jgi:hypothetical protein
MMKYLVVIVAMSVTVVTGIMAKNEKGETTKAETPKAEVAASAAADKMDKTAKGKEDQTTRMLEHIKENDIERYNELVVFKKKRPNAFERIMEELHKKHHAEAGKGGDGKEGNDQKHHPHGPRPYQNQLDRLPDRRHTGDDRER